MRRLLAVFFVAVLQAGCAESPPGGFVLARPPVPIIGGGPADPARWPATFVFESRTGPLVSYCTATVVGRSTVVTGAHCVADGATGSIQGLAGVLTCDHHPAYAGGDRNYDVALCRSSAPFPTSFKFERVNTSVGQLTMNKAVTILGYGCTTEGGDSPTMLYVGSAKISALPTSASPLYVLLGGAVGCEGDSGGAGYDSVDPSRVVLGVMKGANAGTRESTQVSLAAPRVFDFLRNWASQHAQQVCGVTTGAANCRP